MSDPTIPVQEAVIARLDAGSLGIPVWSRLPDNLEIASLTAAVLLEDVTFTGTLTKDGRDWTVSVTVTIVSAARSPRPGAVAARNVANLLHRQQLVAAGADLTSMDLTGTQSETSEDRTLYFTRQTYELIATTN